MLPKSKVTISLRNPQNINMTTPHYPLSNYLCIFIYHLPESEHVYTIIHISRNVHKYIYFFSSIRSIIPLIFLCNSNSYTLTLLVCYNFLILLITSHGSVSVQACFNRGTKLGPEEDYINIYWLRKFTQNNLNI